MKIVKGCPTQNSDCDVWDPVMCACLACKHSFKARDIKTGIVLNSLFLPVFLLDFTFI